MRRATAAIVLVLVALSAPAAAHTAFDSSDPADGETIDGPVTTIEIRFTGAATPVEDEFTVFTPQGDLLTPRWTTADDRTFVLQFSPALGGGDVGVRWHVQAADAHPISGTFTFTVLAPAPTSTPTTTITETSPTTTITEADTTTTQAEAVSEDVGNTDSPTDDDATPADLEEFLADETASDRDWRHAAGRWAGYVGSLLVIGAVAFAIVIGRGELAERQRPIAAAGGLALVGAILHGWGLQSQAGDPSTEQLIAVAVLALGGAVAAGSIRLSEEVRTVAIVSAAVAIAVAPGLEGHSVSEGPRALHALASAIHVAAAGAWVGGLVALLTIAWRARHHDRSDRFVEAAHAFARLATVSLIGVFIAGLAMMVMIIGNPTALADTPWGRAMLVKLVLVGGAAALGAANHFVFLPRMDDASTTRSAVMTMSRLVVAELALLTLASVVTVRLVNASIV